MTTPLRATLTSRHSPGGQALLLWPALEKTPSGFDIDQAIIKGDIIAVQAAPQLQTALEKLAKPVE